jgi:hypothetical protein
VAQASERRNLRLAHVGHRAGADCTHSLHMLPAH